MVGTERIQSPKVPYALVVRLWQLKFDTARIAQMCKVEEAEVCKVVSQYQNVRHALRMKGEAA